MISAPDLILLKSRLMLGADAAHRIATSTDPVFYDQEQYAAVYSALVSMRQDMSRVLAELDVLRGMFHTNVAMWLMEDAANVGVPESGRDVVAVPAEKAGGSGEGEPPVAAGTDGGVQTGRVPGKRTKRSKPRRDSAGDGVLPVAVGRGDGSGEMDSSQIG